MVRIATSLFSKKFIRLRIDEAIRLGDPSEVHDLQIFWAMLLNIQKSIL